MKHTGVVAYKQSQLQLLLLATQPARAQAVLLCRALLQLLGVHTLTAALNIALPTLQALFLLGAWCACIHAVVGLQVFSGRLQRRCSLCADELCSVAQPGSKLWTDLPCGSGRACPAPFVCLPPATQLAGQPLWSSYDTMSWASLSVFRLWMRGGWSVLLHHTAAAVGHARAVAFCLPGVLLSYLVLQPLLLVVLADAVGTARRQLSVDAEEDTSPLTQLLEQLTSAFRAIFPRDREQPGQESARDRAPQEHRRSAWRAAALRLCGSQPARIGLGVAHVANAAAMCVVPPTAAAMGVNVAATATFAVYSALRTAALEYSQLMKVPELLDAGLTVAAVLALIPWNGSSQQGIITLRLLCALYSVATVDIDQVELGWLIILLRRRPLLGRARVATLQAFTAARACGTMALIFVLGCALLGFACFGSFSGPLVTDAPPAIFSGKFDTGSTSLLTSARLLTGSNDWIAAAFGAMELSGSAASVLFFVLAQLAGGIILLSLCSAFVMRGFCYDDDTTPGDDAIVAQTNEVDSARALAAQVNPTASSLEARIGIVKRHAAARVVEAMRNQLASTGHIQGKVGRVFDWNASAVSSSKTDDAVARRSAAAPVAMKDRRRAFKSWITPQSIVAPNGRAFQDAGCDGYPPGALCETANEHWPAVGAFELVSNGLPLPKTLADAYDSRSCRGGQLAGRVHWLRSRRELNARLAAQAGGSAPAQPPDANHGTEADDVDGETASATEATTQNGDARSVVHAPAILERDFDSERSDDEEETSLLANQRLEASRQAQQQSTTPAPYGRLETAPSWLAADSPTAVQQNAYENQARQPRWSCAQARARDVLLSAESRRVAALETDLHGTTVRKSCPAMVDSANLWPPLCNDLALPFLYGDADRVRQAALVPPRPGEVTQCLTIDALRLPLRIRNVVIEDAAEAALLGASMGDEFARQPALWIFSPLSPFRRTLFLMVHDPYVRALRVAGTIAALLLLAIENPRTDPRGEIADRIKHADMAINMLFALELVANLIVYGAIGHKGAFFRRPEGWIDLAALVGGSVGTMSNPRQLRVLRCFRVFSWLRLLRRNAWCQPLSLCLAAIEAAVPTLRALLFTGAWIWFAFAVTAAQIASPGKDESCTDGTLSGRSACHGSFVDPITGAAASRRLLMPVLNFETVPNAAMALFAMSTFDGWTTVAMPFGNSRPGVVALLVVWMGVFGIVWRALVMGAVVDAYVALSHTVIEGRQAGEDGRIRRAWAVARRLQRQQAQRSSELQARRNDEKIAMKAGRLAEARRKLRVALSMQAADVLVLTCLLITTLFSAQWTPSMVQRMPAAQRNQEIVFTILLAAEQLAVLVANGPRHFMSLWPVVDAGVTVAALIRIGLGHSGIPFNPLVLRLLRADRWIRLATTQSRAIPLLRDTCVGAAPHIAAALVLGTMLLVVYALVGMALFGTRMPPPPLSSASPAGRVPADFSSFGRSALTVLRVATTDGWTDMLSQLMACDEVSRPHGAAGPLFTPTCRPRVAPPLFFMSLYLVVQLGCGSLLVATFAASYESACDEAGLRTNIGDTLKRYDLLHRAVTRLMAPVVRARLRRETHLDRLHEATKADNIADK